MSQLDKDIERVKTINTQLRDMNFSWNQIELFWQGCVEIAEKLIENVTPVSDTEVTITCPSCGGEVLENMQTAELYCSCSG